MKTEGEVRARAMSLLTPEQRQRVLEARRFRERSRDNVHEGDIQSLRRMSATDRSPAFSNVIEALGKAVDNCDHLHIRVNENERGTEISIYAGRRST